jgi:hypothetical protein
MLDRLLTAARHRASGPSTREAAVSIALGRLTASELLRSPDAVLPKAQRRVRRLMGDPTVAKGSRRWIEEWGRLLDGPLEDIVAALIDPSDRGYELRQSTPFTGVISEEDRLIAVRRATRDHRASRSA